MADDKFNFINLFDGDDIEQGMAAEEEIEPGDLEGLADSDPGRMLQLLEDNLIDDRGWALEQPQLDIFAQMSMRDKANWARAESILKSFKAFRTTSAGVRERCRELSREGKLELLHKSIIAIIPDADVSPDARVPEGWEMVKDTAKAPGSMPHVLRRLVERRRGDDIETLRKPISRVPLLIKSIQIDKFSGDTYLEIAWKSHGKWYSGVIPRAQVTTSTGLATHLGGSKSFPLHKGNAADLSEYFVDYEEHNTPSLPQKTVSQQMGWHKEGFLLGYDFIGDGEPVDFLPPDAGEAQIAEALMATEGSIDGWRQVVKPLKYYPKVQAAIYASLAPPLLKVLRMPNFLVEWCGDTSKGKSTTMAVAGSIWGDPATQTDTSIIGSWGATRIGVERRMSALSCLPTMLDDTKNLRRYARGETIVPATIYSAVNGQSNTRGSVTGLQRSRNWHTVLISTGEQRLIDFSKDGGTAARVLTMWGSPFGGEIEESIIKDLNRGLRENYGHAGRMFVKWMVEHIDDAPEWRVMFDKAVSEIAPQVAAVGNDGGVSNRLADSLAVLDVAAELAHRVLDLPWEYDQPVRWLIDAVGTEGKTAKRHLEAMEAIASMIASQWGAIQNSDARNDREPPGGWIGYVEDYTSSKPWDYIGLHVSRLKGILSSLGYEPNAIIRQWRDDGMLRVDTPGRSTCRVRIDGNRVAMICPTREALETCGFGDGESVTREIPF